MSFLHHIDNDLILKWLEELNISHYLCGQCQGIHMTDIQSLEGVLESRLFLDEDCLIFTTEIELRNACLFAVQAELPKINSNYAHLKAFLDATDHYNVRLILCDTQWISGGLSRSQLEIFVQSLLDAKGEVISDLQQKGFLCATEEAESDVVASAHFH